MDVFLFLFPDTLTTGRSHDHFRITQAQGHGVSDDQSLLPQTPHDILPVQITIDLNRLRQDDGTVSICGDHLLPFILQVHGEIGLIVVFGDFGLSVDDDGIHGVRVFPIRLAHDMDHAVPDLK